jgi:DNA-binding XRE family transcriptional regulator
MGGCSISPRFNPKIIDLPGGCQAGGRRQSAGSLNVSSSALLLIFASTVNLPYSNLAIPPIRRYIRGAKIATRGIFRHIASEHTMYGNPQRRSAASVQELRREGGRWLRQCREAAGLSQRQLAELVGAEYYTFISQLETGRGRIPPDRYQVWAQALKIAPKEFVRNILRFYDPITYSILFIG